MTARFEAFKATSVLHSLQKKIETVDVWGKKVLSGLSDGTLMVLEPDQEKADAPYQVVKAMRGFGKKSIHQIQVWTEKDLLISLDDEGVSMFHLATFKIHCQANRSRYAQCFAWNPQTAMLAVAVKRKVLLYHFNGNEFVDLKDLSMADSAQCMIWIGEHICIGHKKEYALLDVESGQTTDLFKSSAICMTKLAPSEELLVAKGNVGVILGSSGKVSRRPSLVWSESPVALAFSNPYAIAFLPSYLEIKTTQQISSDSPSQVLQLNGVTERGSSLLSDGSAVMAVGPSGSILRLQPLPFKQQAEHLAAAGQYQEALQLASLIPETEAQERQEVTDRLRIHLGHHEFVEGEFGEAMAQFGMCSNANPVILLNLFPSLASRELLKPLQITIQDFNLPEATEPEGEEFEHAVEVLLPYLMSHKGRLASHRQDQSQPSLSKSSIEESWQDETSLSEGKGSEDVPTPSTSRSYVTSLTETQCSLLECAIDTAILKAMLATSDSGALLRFVQGPNQADLKEGEAALKARGRYAELVALYKSRGLHAAALNLLKSVSLQQELPVPPQGAAAELAGLTGVWAAVRYLVSLSSEHTDLIKRHTRWILKSDPEAGLDMFVQIGHILPPAVALSLLTAQAPAFCASYLEASLENGSARHEEFDHELAGIYLRTALENETDPQPSTSATAGAEESQDASAAQAQALDKLKHLVLSSQYVEPQRLLLMLPADRLHEVRALLLERLGMYKKALRLYVHTMHSPVLAEAYCDRLYQANLRRQSSGGLKSYGSSSNFEIYLTLIQVYLERDEKDEQAENDAESSNWVHVAQLLARKHNIIDPTVALQMVPDQISLATMMGYLENSLRSASQQRRNAAIVKSLRRSENLQMREENVKCKDRSFLVTFERACSICHRRIGTAAFVAYSNNVLAHYSCHKRKQLRDPSEDLF